MDKLSQRDQVLLGYAYRDPFGNLQPRQPHRNSDVDFTDVFGGPPRRSSLYELRRRSRADSVDSFSPLRGKLSGDGVGLGSGRRQSSGLAEKPVFGEAGSPAGRRQPHLGDGFYDDIFPVGDSCSDANRKLDKDGALISAGPGSRILSPNRAGLVGGSARILSPSSPSLNVAKGDHSASGSPTHRAPFKYEDGSADVSAPNTSFFNKIFPPEDDLRKVGHAGYKQSPLAGQGTRAMPSQFQKDISTLESFINKNQFHFSMYKWAGKGVSLAFSSLPKEKTEIIGELTKLPEVVIKAVDLVSDDDNMSTTTAASNIPSEIPDYTPASAVFMEMKEDGDQRITDNILPDDSDSKNFSRSKFGHSGIDGLPAAFSGISTPETRNLQQFFSDSFEEQESLRQNAEQKEVSYQSHKDVADTVKSKKQAQRGKKSDHIQNFDKSTEEKPTATDEKMTGNKVKGKVKDFIKKLSNEAAPKRKSTFETEGKARGKDRTKNRVDGHVDVSAEYVDDEIKPSHKEDTFVFNSTEIGGTAKKHDIGDSYENSSNHVPNSSFSEMNGASKPFSEPIQEPVNTPPPVHKATSSPYEDLERRPVEQKPEQNMKEQDALQQDEIRMADAKVRDWSKGKEGNIRSLLSTLQFVLWTGSGWKPIPLVDIIESTSVKKAYQRALLCLHPDKLQQRGAAMHQKYIAEKVFDILQEAWDQFNSVSAF